MSNTFAKRTLYAAVGGFGAFSVGFIAQDQPTLLSAGLYGFAFGVSALISPAFSSLAGKAKGIAVAGAVLIAGCATIADGWGMSRAWVIMQDTQAKTEYAEAMELYETKIASDEELIKTTTATLAGLSAPVSTDAYTSRLKAATDAYEKQVATLKGIISDAGKRIKEVAKPSTPVLTSAETEQRAFLICVLVQGILALGFIVVGRAERSEPPLLDEPANDETAVSDFDASSLAYSKKANGLELLVFGKAA